MRRRYFKPASVETPHGEIDVLTPEGFARWQHYERTGKLLPVTLKKGRPQKIRADFEVANHYWLLVALKVPLALKTVVKHWNVGDETVRTARRIHRNGCKHHINARKSQGVSLKEQLEGAEAIAEYYREYEQPLERRT